MSSSSSSSSSSPPDTKEIHNLRREVHKLEEENRQMDEEAVIRGDASEEWKTYRDNYKIPSPT